MHSNKTLRFPLLLALLLATTENRRCGPLAPPKVRPLGSSPMRSAPARWPACYRSTVTVEVCSG